jgi:hypothetical protein
MSYSRHVLVLANVTATSETLLDALAQRAEHGPVSFTLVVPVAHTAGGRTAAQEQLEAAQAAAAERGLELTGRLGDSDPLLAGIEAYNPAVHDEIIVATLPSGPSKWLGTDLPHLIQRKTGALVTHVVAAPPAPPPRPVHIEHHDDYGVLKPLTPLTWGRRPGDRDETSARTRHG